MKLVGPAFLARFGGRTINTHPALLPSFPGMLLDLESGLQDADARRIRLGSDRHWATRFRTEALGNVFTDWYQQSVFASLTDMQRRALVTLRSQNSGTMLAMMKDQILEDRYWHTARTVGMMTAADDIVSLTSVWRDLDDQWDGFLDDAYETFQEYADFGFALEQKHKKDRKSVV